ncbi:hypothetical protein M9Y10_019496 [Tritrichomonas musculus]|uniref:Actin n=1 Tax=Tritrichomonas musculus TaxID=1915356 RepID=A0ABR2HHM8_9EUKA
MSSQKAAIFDFGTFETKIGFAGDKKPQKTFYSVVDSSNKHGVGDSAEEVRGRINFIIDNCVVTNWDLMESLITYSFNWLRVKAEDTPVLITESQFNNRGQREKISQILFETFNIPSLTIISQAYLSLLATGSETGMVLNIGEGASFAVPIYESVPSLYALKKCNISGSKINEYMFLLDAYGSGGQKTSFKDKDKLFKDKKNGGHHECMELLFDPSLSGQSGDSITKVLFDSIMAANIDLRKDLFSNIVLSGGSTMFDGFPERIKKEITEMAPDDMNVDIIAQPDRDQLAWKGGSIFATRPEYEKLKLSKDEYLDFLGIIHRQFIY